MTGTIDDEAAADVRRDAKRAAIHRAALEQFTTRGIAGTSMAAIADSAGMSRPALYQYFGNKGDIFASAFVGLFDDRVDAALGALVGPGSTAEQLDRFLQCYDGELWSMLAASSHADELLRAKTGAVIEAVDGVVERLRHGLAAYIDDVAPDAEPAQRFAWVELLRLSPKGLTSDQPTVEAYRLRLTTLARAVAADIDRA